MTQAAAATAVKWLFQVLVPLSIIPLYPGGRLPSDQVTAKAAGRQTDFAYSLVLKHMLTTSSLMSAPLSCNSRFCQLTIIEISQSETFIHAVSFKGSL